MTTHLHHTKCPVALTLNIQPNTFFQTADPGHTTTYNNSLATSSSYIDSGSSAEPQRLGQKHEDDAQRALIHA